MRTQDSRSFQAPVNAAVAVAVVFGLYLCSRYSYLLFHSLVEIATVAVGFTLFMLAWNTRRFPANDALKVIGIGYALIAFVDLLHTLAYKGMNVFPGFDADLPTQLWIGARYLQAATLCTAPVFTGRRIGRGVLFGAYLAAVAAVVVLAYTGNFPACYVEGKGLTTFKIVSEYVITVMLLVSLYLFHRKRKSFSRNVYLLVAASILCTAASELSFTAYLSVYGFANMLGHLLKLAAFYLMYRALLVTGLKEPFDLIFRDMKRAKDELQKAYDGTEEQVRVRTAELRSSEEKYRRIVDTTADGIWMFGPDSLTTFVNARMADMLGYSREEMVGRPARDFMFEQDLADHRSRMEIRSQGKAESYERRFRTKEGKTLWTLASATPTFDDAHEVAGSFAMFTDITERKMAETTIRRLNAELSATLQAIPDLLFDLDRNGTYLDIWAQNPTLLAREKDILLGHTVAEMLPPDAAATVMAAIREADENNASYGKLILLQLAGGPSWFELSVSKKADIDGQGASFIVVSRDVTQRKRAEDSLRRSNRELVAISNCNQALIRAEDEQTLLDTICRIICDQAGYRMACVGFAEHDDAKSVRVVASSGVEDGYLANARIVWADTERGRGPAGTAIRRGEIACIQDFATDPEAAPWRESALPRGYRSSIAIPLKDPDGGTFGVLSIYAGEPNAFSADEIRLLGDLGGDLALGITFLRGRIALRDAERERTAHLHFLESMDRINRAIQGTKEVDRMMSDVLDLTLDVFDCDRAFLMYPCDPDSASWQVPMERTRPEYPGVRALGQTMPMDGEVAATLRILLATDGPATFGPQTGHPLPTDVAERFGFQSFMSMALYPWVGKPWQFGIHSCSRPRQWSAEEQRLLQEIGWRVADGLGMLLAYRDLLESRRKLAEAEQMVHVGYWDCDLATNRVSLSDEVYRIFGLRPEEQIDDWARWNAFRREKIHPEDWAQADRALADALRDGSRFDIEYRLVPDSGRARVIHSRGDVGLDESGRPSRVLATMQDITERKQAEDQLRQLNETLEQRVRDELAKNREKDHVLIQQSRLAAMGEMVHNIAHQWRQPLMALGFLLANIRDSFEFGELTKETLDESLAKGTILVQRMSTTIDDFRDFFRPDKEKCSFPIAGSLREVRGILGAALAHEGIELTDGVGEDIAAYGYDNEFAQVLLNVIDNSKEAIMARRRAQGRIDVQAEVRGGAVELRVADNGGGIPKDVLPRIFDPYFTTKEKGTGIGLYMSKVIIEGNMGGEIAARNVEQGAETLIRIPAAPR